MPNKIVIKTPINGDKCKKTILMEVTKLVGVDEVSIDGEKGAVTVIGDVDATKIVSKLRKAGKQATIESIGPHKNEEPKPDPKKAPEQPADPPPPPPYCYCRREPGNHYYVVLEEASPSCTFL